MSWKPVFFTTKASSRFVWVILLNGAAALAGVHLFEQAPAVILAEGSVARTEIYVPVSLPSAKPVAQDLSRILEKMSGARFSIRETDVLPLSGIVLGTEDAFPELAARLDPLRKDRAFSQGYLVESSPERLLLLGASVLGLEYAVADVLYRLGYRQFFVHSNWEVAPLSENLIFSGRILETPDFFFRNVYSTRIWPEEVASRAWYTRVNRCVGEYLNTGHMYLKFISRRQAVFDAHPEYYAMVDGKREKRGGSTKLCIGNPALRQLMVDYMREQCQANPDQKSFSMDPSDGSSWCECPECLKIGSPSDRAVMLANQVAEMFRKEFPGKTIGMYAYNEHSQPPSIPVAPEVTISVATAFIRGGMSFNDIAAGWRDKGATLGVRDYHDVIIWSEWAPGLSKGSDSDYNTRQLAQYYADGFRSFSSEGGWVFGPNGLGYILSARVLWDVREAEPSRAQAIRSDFLDKAFGPAAEPMGRFYDLIDGKNRPLLTADLIGRMYRSLEDAGELAGNNEAIRNRLADLATYVRYCELLRVKQSTNARVDWAALIGHVARMRSNQMLVTRSAFFYYRRFQDAENKKVDWDHAPPFTVEEALAMIPSGITNNPLVTFKPIRFSEELLPVQLPAVSRGSFSTFRFAKGCLYTWIDDPSKPLQLEVTGGLIAKYRDRGPVKLNMYQLGGASATGEYETLVDTNFSVLPDGTPHSVFLRAHNAGLHKIAINDGGDKSSVVWKPGSKVCLPATATVPLMSWDRSTFFVYVPRGTRQMGFYSSLKTGTLHAPNGQIVMSFDKTSGNGLLDVPVPEGQDGKLWEFRAVMGAVGFLNVPPVVALAANELLLPQEIVHADGLLIPAKALP